MTTGIYTLTFANGHRYIGKSNNIANRWKQHFDKFRKGTAAKAMQHAYNNYGEPIANVTYECHEDHLDIVEETLIFRSKPELNGTLGRERLNYKSENGSHSHMEGLEIDAYLEQSTMCHISEIVKLRTTKAQLTQHLEELIEETETLHHKRSQEELTHDTMGKIKAVEAKANIYKQRMLDNMKQNEILQNEVQQLKSRVYQLNSMSWWQRLFT